MLRSNIDEHAECGGRYRIQIEDLVSPFLFPVKGSRFGSQGRGS
jgi:hypothetical protein